MADEHLTICLSLDTCALHNLGDKAASPGPGPRYALATYRATCRCADPPPWHTERVVPLSRLR